MPDLRLSRLLKAKLSRRPSSRVVPQAATDSNTNEPQAANHQLLLLHRNLHSSSSSNFQSKSHADLHHANNHPSDSSLFSPDHDDSNKTRAYSIVSVAPAERASSPDELGGPPTASTDPGRSFSLVDRPSAGRDQLDDDPSGRSGSDHDRIDVGYQKEKENGIIIKEEDSLQPPAPRTSNARLQQEQQQQQGAHPTNLLSPPENSSSRPISSQQAHGPSSQPADSDAPGTTLAEPPEAAPSSLGPVTEIQSGNPDVQPSGTSSAVPKRPTLAVRRQSLLPISQQHLISGLLDPTLLFPPTSQPASRPTTARPAPMAYRKVWVKRPGGSATLVTTVEDGLVDELRDQIVRKYTNSIGKSFDSPDIFIRVVPREDSNRQATPERVLNPEESISAVIETYFPGGQTVEEALIIDMPQRRTPKPSPRHTSVYYHHTEPGEDGGYFPLLPVNANGPSPGAVTANAATTVNGHQAPSISILTTGMAPPLPSPGSRARHARRPPLTRHTTNSPTILGSTPPGIQKDAGVTSNGHSTTQVQQIPTPPAPPPESPQNHVQTPPPRGVSPRPGRKTKKPGTPSAAAAFGGLIEGTVPPINVLIVEDNIINQKLLEAFMKRLSVRWKCAANGEEAVRKWRQGGFHLVLMDIQLPVMNGLEATKEIRRLERSNGIGVFSKTASGRSSVSSANATPITESASDEMQSPRARDEDLLHDMSLFKSPVIIVALTASSLQSDRHEALAAGCNDFLTKPVAFPWLEQKVTEWGCMQALIDFEGWRKWRGFADSTQASPTIDSQASPMRMGNGDPINNTNIGSGSGNDDNNGNNGNNKKRTSSTSPASARTTTTHPNSRRPSIPRRESNSNTESRPELIREGSSSGDNGTVESPSSSATVVPAGGNAG